MPRDTDRATSTNRPPLTSPYPDKLPPPDRSGLIVRRTRGNSTRSKTPGDGGRESPYKKTLRGWRPPPTLTTGGRYYQGTNVPEDFRSAYFTKRQRFPSPPPPRNATPSDRPRDLDRPPTPTASRPHDWGRRIIPPDDTDWCRERYICRRRLGVQGNRDDIQNGDTPRSTLCLLLVMPEGAPVHSVPASNAPAARLWLARRVGNNGFQIIQPLQ